MESNREALLDFLNKVWGVGTAKVYLAYKPDPSNHGSFDVPNGQVWPEKSDKIPLWIMGNSRLNKDVYFSPALYDLKANSKEKKNVIGSWVLWCDFDGNAKEALAKLRATEGLPEPTWRIQSGLPGHEHWYWLLSRQEATERFEQMNKKLAYYLDADMGCWSAEHVMRPPFTQNTLQAKKYAGKYDEGVPVDFIAINESAYDIESFDFLPDIKSSIIENVHLKEIPDIKDVLARYSWDSLHLELFNNPPTEDRSNVLVRLGYHGAEVGMPDEAIYAVIDDVDKRVGKFVGRSDRERRLAQIIAKVRVKHPYVEVPINNTDQDARLVYGVRDLLQTDWKLEWLVEGFLPKRTINFISAESGIGKSRLALQLADAMARGIPFLGWKIERKFKVMYLSLEMNGPMLKEFIVKLSAESDDIDDELNENFMLVPVGNPINLETPDGADFIEMLVSEYKPDLLFIDALGSLTFEEIKEKQAKLINNQLKRLLTKYETTYYIIHHNRKPDISGKKRPTLGDIYGSQYIITDAAVVITMYQPDTQAKVELLPVKTRFGVSFDPVFMNGKDQFKFVVREDHGDNGGEKRYGDIGV